MNQRQREQYFNIDRRFSSADVLSIEGALDEVDLFLNSQSKIDFANALIIRMLQIFQNNKSLTIKQKILNIFHHHSYIFQKIHSKDQVINVLARVLKNSDTYTRIICMKAVRHLSNFFIKDTAVYHMLLSKLANNSGLTKQQKKQAVLCLSHLLQQSRHLDKLFSKNFKEFQMLYNIPLHLITFLLNYVAVDSHTQKRIIEDVLELFEKATCGREEMQRKNMKKAQKHFEKLILKYAKNNFKIVQLYDSKLFHKFPRIKGKIQQLKVSKYIFLIQGANKRQISNVSESTEQFIQRMYSKKIAGQCLQQDEQRMTSLIDGQLNNSQASFRSVLLVFFVKDSTKYDNYLSQHIKSNCISSNIIFKQLLAAGCYRSADSMLDYLSISQNVYIWIKSYLRLKIQQDFSSFVELKQISQIISPILSLLVRSWQICYLLLREGGDIQHERHTLVQNLKKLSGELSSFKVLHNNLEMMNIFIREFEGNGWASDLGQRIFEQCRYLPRSLNMFWFAYVFKPTILSLL